MGNQLLEYEWKPDILAGHYLSPDYSLAWEDTPMAQERIKQWVGIFIDRWEELRLDQPIQAFFKEYWHKPLPEIVPPSGNYWSSAQKAVILEKLHHMLGVGRDSRVYVNGDKAYTLILGNVKFVNGRVVPHEMYLTSDAFTLFVDPVADYASWWQDGAAELGKNSIHVNPPLKEFIKFLADPATISLKTYFQLKEYGTQL